MSKNMHYFTDFLNYLSDYKRFEKDSVPWSELALYTAHIHM
jgi:hypothetical protein